MKVARLAKKFQDCTFEFFKSDTYIGSYNSNKIKSNRWISQQKIKSCALAENKSIKIILK